MKAATLLQQAVDLENRGQIAEAIKAYQKALSREPSNVEALTRLGHVLVEQGQFDVAATMLRRAVTLRPEHALALTLLGIALSQSGDRQEALGFFERAARADPASDTALIYQADALDTLGRADEAIAVFDRAIAVNPQNPLSWNNRGVVLENLGRDADAAASFQRVVALRPNSAEAHFNLANTLHRLKRYDEAVAHYQQTVALAPDFVRAYANLGNTLFELQRWEDALQILQHAVRLQPNDAKLYQVIGTTFRHLERERDAMESFDKALSIDPNNSDIMSSKARLLQVLGRFDEARALTESALALKPRDARLHINLSELTRFMPGDPRIATMEALLSDSETQSDSEKIDMHFALAKAYRDLGDTAVSFRHLLKANALKRREFVYDEAIAFAGIERIVQVFSPALLPSKAGQGDTSRHPIFVVGMPRSGTTLVEQILASHPKVFGAGEQKKFMEACAPLMAPGLSGYPDFVPALTPSQLKELGARYLAGMAPLIGDHDFFTDKLPANYYYVGLIHLALPNARFIHTRRDPVDTCLSCFSTHFAEPPKFTNDLGELGRFYRNYERLMDHWRRVLPEGVMIDIQYEDVVDDIDQHAHRIVAHCGLNWDDACLAFYENKRPVHTASFAQVRQPIYRSSLGRWRPYREHLQPLFDALGITPPA